MKDGGAFYLLHLHKLGIDCGAGESFSSFCDISAGEKNLFLGIVSYYYAW